MAEWQDGRMALLELQNGRIGGWQNFTSLLVELRACKAFLVGMLRATALRVNQKAEVLKERTRRFALDVMALVDTLPKTPDGEVVGRQLLKAGTSVAANYRSACRARSHREFTARIGVVLEEADEAEFWLSVVRDRRMSASETVPRLCDESTQLRAIFSAANLTARDHSRSRLDYPITKFSYTPAAAAARCASSTPITTVAPGLPSPPAPYAYSTLMFASETRRKVGASVPGAFATAMTITSRSMTW